MRLITYTTSKVGYLEALEKSAKRNGFEIIILGQGKEWNGLNQKFMDVGEYLHSLPNKEEVVCYVDGYDCVVLGTSEEMMHHYKKKKTDKVIFSVDPPLFNRPNSGCYIGKIASVQELLKKLCATVDCKPESKELVSHYYPQFVDYLELDVDHVFFYNLPNQDYEVPLQNQYYRMEDQKRLLLLSNQKRPIILHGHRNLNMNKMMQYLNLPIAIDSNDSFKKKYRILFKALYVILQILHVLIGLFIYLFIFFAQRPFWISFFILLWFCIIIQWYICKNCVLSYVETFLDETKREKQENGAEYSFLQDLFIRVFGEKFSFYLTTAIIPLSLVTFALYKLNRAVCSTTIATKTKKK